MPFTQVEPAWQAMPQAPQLLLSVRVLVQTPQEVGLSATRVEGREGTVGHFHCHSA